MATDDQVIGQKEEIQTMENPGLKRYISTGPDPIQKEAFLTIIERRTASALMPAPHTDTTESNRSKYPMSDLNSQDNRDGEGHLRRDDIETPPPGKGSNTPGPSADNGAYGADPWIREHQHHPNNYRSAGVPATMVPGEVRVKRSPTSSGEPLDTSDQAAQLIEQQNKAAEQRRIDTQKQVGGGAWENPAYEEAQDQIRARMQERREAATSDEYHGPFDMAGFEQDLNYPDPLVDTHGPGIHSVDPRSPQYDTDYERGWQASQEYDGDPASPHYRAPLEEMDDSNASHAAYDGYFDYAAGRPKWAHRAWRRLGEPGQGPDDGLPDEHWAAPHKVAGTQFESCPSCGSIDDVFHRPDRERGEDYNNRGCDNCGFNWAVDDDGPLGPDSMVMKHEGTHGPKEKADIAKENPAYEHGQDQVDQRMMLRKLRTGSDHPLFRAPLVKGAVLVPELSPDEELGLQVFRDTDFEPNEYSHTVQPMIQLKETMEPFRGVPNRFGSLPCETCWLADGRANITADVHDEELRNIEDLTRAPGHEFKPMGTEQRYSSLLQAAYDYKRNEWLYDVDNPVYFEVDPAPSRDSGTRQSLLAIKPDHLYGGPVSRRIPDEEDTISDGAERWGGDTYRENELTREKASERLSALKPSDRHDLSEYGLNVFEDTRYPPPMGAATTSQPMIDIKRTDPHPEREEVMDDPATYNPEGSCETCWLEDDNPHVGREQHEDRGYEHEFRPFGRSPGQRYSRHRLNDDDDPRAELEGLVRGLPAAGSPVAYTRPTFDQMNILAEMGFGRHGDPDNHPYWFRRDPDKDYIIAPQIDGYWEQSSGPHGHWDQDSRDHVMPTAHPSFAEALEGMQAPPRADPRRPGKSRDFDAHLRDQVIQPPDRRIDPMAMREPGAHPYPFPANPGLQSFNSRISAQVPDHDDPVYPYSGRVDPEDTVDPDNLQTGDDAYRPHHPLVDRAIHHMQGLPDVGRGHPLMDRVNEVINEGPEEDTEEGERGRNALAEGLNTIFDSARETEGQSYDERLQAGKDAIDAHIETGRLSHKEHVKRLHDDWLARGGHATGEPRPVERFSTKYQKPQQIVPDPNNPFPELTSPIHMVGKCEGCGKRLYDSADNSGDPRGALGDSTAMTLDAAEYDPPGDTEGDRRMHGPSALICPSCDSDAERQERILDRYRGHKAGEMSQGGHWGWPEGADTRDWKARRFIPHRFPKDRKGKWHSPGEKPGECYECDNGIEGWHRRNPNQPGQKTGAVHSLHKQGETDEQFWARMEREHPGEQPTGIYSGVNADTAGQSFDDLDSWEDNDDVIPERMSLRDHSRLVNSGIYQWDEDLRYPRYTHNVGREVRDSEGRPAHAHEGHVIEHNTGNHGPVLPTSDDPDPPSLLYPWSHTYYPAGMSDDEGLTKGYNTVDQAMRAATQLSLWGARHPKSQQVLQGYRYVGSEEPYDPTVELPHEKAMRRQGSYDRARGEFLYDIDRPRYWETDKPPSSQGSSRQPMFQLKKIHDGTEFRDQLDGAYNHPGYPVCGWCAMNGMVGYGPEDSVHRPEGNTDPIAHKYQTVEDLPPGTRLATAR